MKRIISLLLSVSLIVGLFACSIVSSRADDTKVIIVDIDGVFTKDGNAWYFYDGVWHDNHFDILKKGEKTPPTNYAEFGDPNPDRNQIKEYLTKVEKETGKDYTKWKNKIEGSGYPYLQAVGLINGYFGVLKKYPEKVQVLKDLCNETGAKVAFCSSWRNMGADFLKDILDLWGIGAERYYGATYNYNYNGTSASDTAKTIAKKTGGVTDAEIKSDATTVRALEILDFVMDQKLKYFCVIDDMPVVKCIGNDHAINFLGTVGLQESDKSTVLANLKKEFTSGVPQQETEVDEDLPDAEVRFSYSNADFDWDKDIIKGYKYVDNKTALTDGSFTAFVNDGSKDIYSICNDEPKTKIVDGEIGVNIHTDYWGAKGYTNPTTFIFKLKNKSDIKEILFDGNTLGGVYSIKKYDIAVADSLTGTQKTIYSYDKTASNKGARITFKNTVSAGVIYLHVYTDADMHYPRLTEFAVFSSSTATSSTATSSTATSSTSTSSVASQTASTASKATSSVASSAVVSTASTGTVSTASAISSAAVSSETSSTVSAATSSTAVSEVTSTASEASSNAPAVSSEASAEPTTSATQSTASTETKIIYKLKECPHIQTAVKVLSNPTYFASGRTITVCAACGKYFSTDTQSALTLKKPKITLKAGKGKITLKCSKATGANRYQFKYRIKGKKWSEIMTIKSKKKVIKKLKKGKIYQFKVRAQVENGNQIASSSWVSKKSKKVK